MTHRMVRLDLTELVYRIDATSLKFNELSAKWARCSARACGANQSDVVSPLTFIRQVPGNSMSRRDMANRRAPRTPRPQGPGPGLQAGRAMRTSRDRTAVRESFLCRSLVEIKLKSCGSHPSMTVDRDDR